MVKIKDFSRPLGVFQILFKANLIFKDFSRHKTVLKSVIFHPLRVDFQPMAYICSHSAIFVAIGYNG